MLLLLACWEQVMDRGGSIPGTVADTAEPPRANVSGACVSWRASACGPSVTELTETNSLKGGAHCYVSREMLGSETQRCHPSRLPIGKRKEHPKERSQPKPKQGPRSLLLVAQASPVSLGVSLLRRGSYEQSAISSSISGGPVSGLCLQSPTGGF